MSEPQIARRCPTCGVSIREAALFCPQCGIALTAPPSNQEAQNPTSQTADLSRTAPLHTEPPSTIDQKFSDTVAIPPSAPVNPPPKTAVQATARARGAVSAKLQPATNLARRVEGDVVQRVHKVKEISSVVLDEAGDDPSLRFVLIAIIVFIVFLVFALLNKLIS